MNFSSFFDLFTEARRNPNINSKKSVLDILEKYKDDETVFMSFRNYVPRYPQGNAKRVKKDDEIDPGIGINPRNSFSTPTGIYGYVVAPMWENNILTKKFDFASDRPLIYVYKPKKGYRVVFSSNYLDHHFQDDKQHIQQTLQLSDSEMEFFEQKLKENSWAHSAFRKLWTLTRDIAQSQVQDTPRPSFTPDCPHCSAWSKIFIKIGIPVVVDDAGTGTIHSNEPIQCVVFGRKYVDILEKIENKNWKTVGETGLLKIINKINDIIGGDNQYPATLIDKIKDKIKDEQISSFFSNSSREEILHKIPLQHLEELLDRALELGSFVSSLKAYGSRTSTDTVYPDKLISQLASSIIDNIKPTSTSKRLIKIEIYFKLAENFDKKINVDICRELIRILLTIGGFDLPRVVSQIVPVLDRWKDDPEYNMLAAMLLMKTLPSLFNSSDDYLMTALVPFLYENIHAHEIWNKIEKQLQKDETTYRKVQVTHFIIKIEDYMKRGANSISLLQYAPDSLIDLLIDIIQTDMPNLFTQFTAVWLTAVKTLDKIPQKILNSICLYNLLYIGDINDLNIKSPIKDDVLQHWIENLKNDKSSIDDLTFAINKIGLSDIMSITDLKANILKLPEAIKDAILQSNNAQIKRYHIESVFKSANDITTINKIIDAVELLNLNVMNHLSESSIATLINNREINREKLFTKEIMQQLFDNHMGYLRDLPYTIRDLYSAIRFYAPIFPIIEKHDQIMNRLFSQMYLDDNMSRKDLIDWSLIAFNYSSTSEYTPNNLEQFTDALSHLVFENFFKKEKKEPVIPDDPAKLLHGLVEITKGSHYIRWAEEIPFPIFDEYENRIYADVRAEYGTRYMYVNDYFEYFSYDEKLHKKITLLQKDITETISTEWERIRGIAFNEFNHFYFRAGENDIMIPVGTSDMIKNNAYKLKIPNILYHKVEKQQTYIFGYISGNRLFTGSNGTEKTTNYFLPRREWNRIFGELPSFFKPSVDEIKENIKIKYTLLAANPPKDMPNDAIMRGPIYIGKGTGLPFPYAFSDLNFYNQMILINSSPVYNYDPISDDFILDRTNKSNVEYFLARSTWEYIFGNDPPPPRRTVPPADTNDTEFEQI